MKYLNLYDTHETYANLPLTPNYNERVVCCNDSFGVHYKEPIWDLIWSWSGENELVDKQYNNLYEWQRTLYPAQNDMVRTVINYNGDYNLTHGDAWSCVDAYGHRPIYDSTNKCYKIGVKDTGDLETITSPKLTDTDYKFFYSNQILHIDYYWKITMRVKLLNYLMALPMPENNKVYPHQYLLDINAGNGYSQKGIGFYCDFYGSINTNKLKISTYNRLFGSNTYAEHPGYNVDALFDCDPNNDILEIEWMSLPYDANNSISAIRLNCNQTHYAKEPYPNVSLTLNLSPQSTSNLMAPFIIGGPNALNGGYGASKFLLYDMKIYEGFNNDYFSGEDI